MLDCAGKYLYRCHCMQKILRLFNALVPQFGRYRREKLEQVQHRLLERPSREDVLHGFRLILGREPENQQTIDALMHIPSVAELRRTLLGSTEFQSQYMVMRPEPYEHPSLSIERETIVFIHMQKTGGTTLRALLKGQFPADRVCPVRVDKLHLLSVAELGQFDFFAGHFDRSSIRFIPREEIKTVALFREPRARLISFYRFLRSHPTRDEFATDPSIRLANELTAEEFFERPEIRGLPAVYNHYLIALGASFSWFKRNQGSLSKEDMSRAFDKAKRQIRAITAIGITERFDQSVELICKALHIDKRPSIAPLHVTSNFVELDARFKVVEPVAMTPRLASALHELTLYDDELYRLATQEFDRRCTELRVSASD
jgi:hypothetical protein